MKEMEMRARELANKTKENIDDLSQQEARALAHELQVYKIELELQNEELRETQLALEDSRQHYFSLYNGAPVGYVVLDKAGMIREANCTFYEMVLVPHGQLIGCALADLLSDNDAHLFRSRLRSFIKNPEDKSIVLRLKNIKNIIKYVQIDTSAFEFSPKDSSKILVTISDVTSLRNAQDALRAAESDYRNLFLNTSDAIIICDLQGNISIFNPASEKLFGVAARDAIGTNISRFCPKERQDEQKDMIKYIINNGMSKSFETDRIKEDGTKIRVEISVSLNKNKHDEPSGISAIIRDISWRKEAEAIIEKQRMTLTHVVEATNVGTWEWNVQTGETEFNDRWAEMLGYRLSELSPFSIETWVSLTHPDDLKVSYSMLEDHFSGKTDFYDCEFRMRHKCGRWVWIHNHGKVIDWTSDGKPLKMYGTHRDITEKKKIEKELVDSREKLINIFENMHSVIWSLSWPELKVLFLTPSVEKIYGRSVKDFYDNHNLWRELVHPEDQAATDAAINDLLVTGKSERKCRIIKPDGSIVWILDKGHLVYDDLGQPIRVDGLTADISEVQVLKGLLPICSQCKKIRDDQGYWESLENYFMEHGGAEFTHSICPDCAREFYRNIGKY